MLTLLEGNQRFRLEDEVSQQMREDEYCQGF